jgi:Ca2+-binding EF-hand superfamily protein
MLLGNAGREAMLVDHRLYLRVAGVGLALLPLLACSAGFAQPGGPPPNASPARGERTMAMLRALDTNQNGRIDANEVNPQQKATLERVLKKYGMDATLPVSIEKIAAAQQAFYAARDAKAAAPTPATPAATSSSSSASAFGAGSSGGSPTVSGFGSGTSGSSSSSSGASRAGVTGFGSSGSGNPAEAKYRRYAEMLLKQYDKNHNGVLDPEEWSQMRGDWKSADLNGDGKLTVDEITAHLMGYSQRRAQQTAPVPAVSSSAGPSATTASTTAAAGSGTTTSWRPAGDGRKAYRFLTPTERLPSGLPEWFLQKQHDGQVTMADFSSTWNDTVAAEFATYDRNNDGVITAEECLQAEKLKAQSASAPQPHAAPTTTAH